MGVIFVGSTVDRETLKSLKDASVAGNKMELGFVKGFINNGIKTIAISVEAHGMWKMNDRPLYVCGRRLQDENAEIITIPYINLPVIKQLMIIYNLKKKMKEYVANDEYRKSTLVVYNTMTIFAKPVISIAHKYNLKSLAIIADLPIKYKKNIFRMIEDKRQISAISKFDALIPLTEYIAKDFAPQNPYYVVEAGCNPSDYIETAYNEKVKMTKTIVFSGTLNQLSGIELLLDAMEKVLNPDIHLEVYGDGPLKQYVAEKTALLQNVSFFGHVPNDQMIQIQRSADLLVCPRRTDDFTTKYTFPSKVLEYICSGVPVLSNKLPGIPTEYENYITFAQSESAIDWAHTIEEILSPEKYDYYFDKAYKACQTVFQVKSWDSQVCNLIEYFRENGFTID